MAAARKARWHSGFSGIPCARQLYLAGRIRKAQQRPPMKMGPSRSSLWVKEGVHPHCNGKSPEVIEGRGVCGRPLSKRVHKPLKQKEIDEQRWRASSTMGRVDVHPRCSRMSGKERTYRALSLYEWQIKDLGDREADAERRSRGKERAGAWQTRKRIAEKYPACQLLYWYRSNKLWKSVRTDEQTNLSQYPHPLIAKGAAPG